MHGRIAVSISADAHELAGEYADAAVPGLRVHLDGCPACREEHESLPAFVSAEPIL